MTIKSKPPLKINTIYGLLSAKDIHASRVPDGWETHLRGYWGYRRKENAFTAFRENIPVLRSTDGHVGLEVEIEDVSFTLDSKASPDWLIQNDGSLRNHGREFVSHILHASDVRSSLASLYLFLSSCLGKKPSFSWRTSIHVHLDVGDLTTAELGNLILLYTVFESSLFRFSCEDRKKSVFCVPLTRTLLTNDINLLLNDTGNGNDITPTLFERWSKYSALNIGRLRDLGTMEFRHLNGEWDAGKVALWVDLILALKEASVRLSRGCITDYIKEMNTFSNYADFQRLVFRGLTTVLPNTYSMKQELSTGFSFAKECLINNHPLFYPQHQFPKNSGVSAFVLRTKEEAAAYWLKQKAKQGEKKSLSTMSFDEVSALVGEVTGVPPVSTGMAINVPPPTASLGSINQSVNAWWQDEIVPYVPPN